MEAVAPMLEYVSQAKNWWVLGPSIYFVIALVLAGLGHIIIYEDNKDLMISFLPVALPAAVLAILLALNIENWGVWQWPLIIFEGLMLATLLVMCFKSNQSIWRTLMAYPLKVIFGVTGMLAIIYVFDTDKSRSEIRSRMIVLLPFAALLFVLVNGERARLKV